MKKVTLSLGIIIWFALSTCCTSNPFSDWEDGGGMVIPGGGGGGTGTVDSSGNLLEFDISLDESDDDFTDSGEKVVTDSKDENYDDFVENSSFTSKVTIAYSGTSATVTNAVAGVSVTQSGAHVTVTSTAKAVEYVLSGTTTNGSLKVYSDNKFKLTLNGAHLTHPKGAPINIQSGKRVFVVSADGTENSLTDGTSYTLTDNEDMKGCFFSEGQLIFSGSGQLTVAGNSKHAICSDDYVRFRQGSRVTVSKAVKDGIHTNDAVIIGGGRLKISATDDGIQCEEGDITITGGKSTILTTGNGTYSDNDISSSSAINGGVGLTISGGIVEVKSTGSAGKGMNIDGNISITSGTVKAITTGKQYVYGKLDSSAKGIKSKANITIDGGTIWVKTPGGEGSEGIESKNILTINGGDVAIYAYDDAINASKNITINGGNVYCYSSGNDGIDSNGTLTVTGGVVISSGTTAPEEGFDCDQNTFKITGGILVGTGGSTSTPTASACTQRSLLYGTTGTSGQLISVVSSDGKTNLLTYKIPRTYSQMTFVFSSPQLTSGSYIVYKGGEYSGGTSAYGRYTGGTYSGGTQATTFTASSMVTSVGTTSGGGGGGPRW